LFGLVVVYSLRLGAFGAAWVSGRVCEKSSMQQ